MTDGKMIAHVIDDLYRKTTVAVQHGRASLDHMYFHNACYKAWPALWELIEAAYSCRNVKEQVPTNSLEGIEKALQHLESL